MSIATLRPNMTSINLSNKRFILCSPHRIHLKTLYHTRNLYHIFSYPFSLSRSMRLFLHSLGSFFNHSFVDFRISKKPERLVVNLISSWVGVLFPRYGLSSIRCALFREISLNKINGEWMKFFPVTITIFTWNTKYTKCSELDILFDLKAVKTVDRKK